MPRLLPLRLPLPSLLVMVDGLSLQDSRLIANPNSCRFPTRTVCLFPVTALVTIGSTMVLLLLGPFKPIRLQGAGSLPSTPAWQRCPSSPLLAAPFRSLLPFPVPVPVPPLHVLCCCCCFRPQTYKRCPPCKFCSPSNEVVVALASMEEVPALSSPIRPKARFDPICGSCSRHSCPSKVLEAVPCLDEDAPTICMQLPPGK